MEMLRRDPITRTSAAACATLALALSLLSTGAAIASSPPQARAAGRCSLAGKYRSLGPTYVELLSVSHTSCATGVNVIKAYNHCRLAAGGLKGYCRSRVLGFRCSEHRQTSSIQYLANVRCTNGRELVTYSYTQNT